MSEQRVSRVLFPAAVTRRGTVIIPLGFRLPGTSSDLPGSFGRAALKHSPIWSCSGWGLPSVQCHHRTWWALTSPFHPYPLGGGRSGFCGTFLRVAPSPRYGPPCPAEPGLSSRFHMGNRRSPELLRH